MAFQVSCLAFCLGLHLHGLCLGLCQTRPESRATDFRAVLVYCHQHAQMSLQNRAGTNPGLHR